MSGNAGRRAETEPRVVVAVDIWIEEVKRRTKER